MMGYGGFGSGGSYPSPSSSSSNLSASAPPFTLDRSAKPSPTPLVDIVEPSYSGHMMNSSLTNWLSARSPTSELGTYDYRGGLQTVESSSTVVSASADPFGYGGLPASDNVAKPCYSSYLSPTTHKDAPFANSEQASYGWSSSSRVSAALDSSCNDYPQRLSDSKYGAEWGDGLWNGFAEWKQGKQSHGSFGSKEAEVAVPYMYENYMNPEAKIPKASSRVGESSHCIDFLEMENHGGTSNVETLVEKDFLGKTSGFIHVDFSRSALGSTQLQSPLAAFGTSSVTHQLPYNASSEHQLKHSGNDGISTSNSRASAPNNATCEIMNDFHSQCISANKPVFDPSHLRVHLERDCPISSASYLAQVEEMASKEFPGIPSSGHEKFNTNLNKVETVNSVHESSEGVDHYNHAVDSPCWKGVPVTHSSPFDSPKVVPDLNNIEKVSSQKLNGSTAYNEVGEQKSEDATKVCNNSETNAVQRLDETPCDKLGTVTQTIDVPGLVNTLHNLSEFLLFHCTSGSFQLKEKEVEAVQSVMNNLSACVSKNNEKIVSTRLPISTVKDGHFDHLGCLHKVSTPDSCQVPNTSSSIQAVLVARNTQTSEKDEEMGDQNIIDEDKATLAHKKILMENFIEDETQPQTLLYKNLWLEAEAALCSVNYKARYTRMKIEMENFKSLNSKDAHENTVTTTHMKKPLEAVVSSDSDVFETSTPNDESFEATKSQAVTGLTPTHEGDVMARFRILKCRIENSNYSTPANAAKLSSSMASPRSDNVIKALPEEQEEKKVSPKPETSANNNINDFDASVIARFHVLKSREDITEVQQPAVETKLPRFASQRTRWPVIGSVPEIGSSGVNPDTEITEGHFPRTEFRMYFGQDDPRAQPQTHNAYRPPENTALQLGFERVSSDWEHVRKEDLGWQNRC